MKNVILAVLFAFGFQTGQKSFETIPQFDKVSDHCYCLRLEETGENVAIVATDEGTLMVDPPHEPGLSLAVEALKRMNAKAVRWVVFTDPSFPGTAGARFFAEQGAFFLASAQLRALAKPEITVPAREPVEGKAAPKSGPARGEAPSFRWLVFDHQMRLFPSDLEIRITALRHKARTGGDVVVYVPAEKVLLVGELYEAARYPDIDISSEGDAAEWIEGLKQVIDSVPVLKSAIPQDKPASKEEPEKTVEEQIAVISAHGEVSNLQNMVDLLDACQKLKRYVSKAVKTGHTCDRFLASSVSNPYKSYGNLAPYAAQLFEALEPAAAITRSPKSK
jgi:glyoxylase-like metal-dependent hydrolase (beta-lactamase superfamily II)